MACDNILRAKNKIIRRCIDCSEKIFKRTAKRCKRCFYKSRTTPAEERFWKYVDKTPTCWLWIGSRNKQGYGRFSLGVNRDTRAHKFSWTIHNGPVPKGLCICHKCDNPPCVSPEHLFIGTHKDNAVDMVNKGRGLAGEKHPRRKLSNSDVLSIKEMRGKFMLKEIAKKFNVTKGTIQDIFYRRTWTHI